MEKQGHKDISLRASIAFLFYRFLCPAILNPELYDIYESKYILSILFLINIFRKY